MSCVTISPYCGFEFVFKFDHGKEIKAIKIRLLIFSRRLIFCCQHHLQTVQTIVENVYVWLVGPRRTVSER